MTETQNLQAFKAYVHKRLDAMGVPENPEPARTLETGCRIGPRLDWLEEARIIAQDFHRHYAQGMSDELNQVHARAGRLFDQCD